MAAPVRKGEGRGQDRLARLRRERGGPTRRLRRLRARRPPGDLVRARATKVKRGFAEASRTVLLEPGPGRIEAPCRHFGTCGGCRFQDLDYALQLEAKQAQVRDALVRLGGFADPPIEPIVPARSQFRYRNKLEYSFAGDDGLVLGFHRAGRWDEVIDVEECLLDRPRQRDSRGGQAVGARGGSRAVRPGDADGLPAPPRRPRGAQHRAGARHRPRRALRRRLPDRDADALPGGAVDQLGRQRPPGRGHEPPHACAVG